MNTGKTFKATLFDLTIFSLIFVNFDWNGEQLIRTTYSTLSGCYNSPESEIVDVSKLPILSGSLAIRSGDYNFYNRVLEKDLPLPCEDAEPDLTLTLEDIAGLWVSPLESGKEFYYHITADGEKTLYSNVASGGDCLYKSKNPSKLTRMPSGRFSDVLLGNGELLSFAKPANDSLIMFRGANEFKTNYLAAETTLEDLNSRTCD